MNRCESIRTAASPKIHGAKPLPHKLRAGLTAGALPEVAAIPCDGGTVAGKHPHSQPTTGLRPKFKMQSNLQLQDSEELISRIDQQAGIRPSPQRGTGAKVPRRACRGLYYPNTGNRSEALPGASAGHAKTHGGLLRGFTLMELLTVIAVISVLAGLLIPVVSSVRDKARSVKCLSNVRQIGLAAYLYSQDHDVYVGWDSVTDRKELLYPYLNTGRSNRDTEGDQIWHCPDNTQRDREASYGFNTNLNWQPIAAIRQPSRTVALADAGMTDAGEPTLATHLMPPSRTTTSNIGRPNPRHDLGGEPAVSVAFADGHARTMKVAPPFYPGVPGEWTGNGVTDPTAPGYQDDLWDLN